MARERKERRQTTTARLPAELLRKARVVAAYRGVELGAYLVGLLEGQVDHDYAEIVRPEKKHTRKGGPAE
jgi:hypothetical protein